MDKFTVLNGIVAEKDDEIALLHLPSDDRHTEDSTAL